VTATPVAAAVIAQLEAEGVDTVIGTVVNPAGLTQAKTSQSSGPACSPIRVWAPALRGMPLPSTKRASLHRRYRVVGDQRVRIDLSALRIFGDGLAWGPAAFFEQDGTAVPRAAAGH